MPAPGPASVRRVEERRARQILYFHGAGLSAQQIGKFMNLKPRTVKRVLKAAGIQEERNTTMTEKNALTQEQIERILLKREWDHFESPENQKRIREYAERNGIDFGEAAIMLAEKDFAGFTLPAAPGENVALDETDYAGQLQSPTVDAEEVRLDDRARELVDREGISYAEALGRATRGEY